MRASFLREVSASLSRRSRAVSRVCRASETRETRILSGEMLKFEIVARISWGWLVGIGVAIVGGGSDLPTRGPLREAFWRFGWFMFVGVLVLIRDNK